MNSIYIRGYHERDLDNTASCPRHCYLCDNQGIQHSLQPFSLLTRGFLFIFSPKGHLYIYTKEIKMEMCSLFSIVCCYTIFSLSTSIGLWSVIKSQCKQWVVHVKQRSFLINLYNKDEPCDRVNKINMHLVAIMAETRIETLLE